MPQRKKLNARLATCVTTGGCTTISAALYYTLPIGVYGLVPMALCGSLFSFSYLAPHAVNIPEYCYCPSCCLTDTDECCLPNNAQPEPPFINDGTVLESQPLNVNSAAYSASNFHAYNTFMASNNNAKVNIKLSNQERLNKIISDPNFKKLLSDGISTGMFTSINNLEDFNDFMKKYQDCVDCDLMDEPLLFPDGQAIDERTYNVLKSKSTNKIIQHPITRYEVTVDQNLPTHISLKKEILDCLESLERKLGELRVAPGLATISLS